MEFALLDAEPAVRQECARDLAGAKAQIGAHPFSAPAARSSRIVRVPLTGSRSAANEASAGVIVANAAGSTAPNSIDRSIARSAAE